MTLTKAELAEEVRQKIGLSKLVSKAIIDQIFAEIRLHLEQGKPVKISGFGNFEERYKRARPGRNPKTGEPKVIQARRVVTFKAGQKLKAKIQQERAKDALEEEKA